MPRSAFSGSVMFPTTSVRLILRFNGHREVPQLEHLNKLGDWYMSNNKITILKDGDFKLYPSLYEIDLHGNQISVIENGAFKGTKVKRITISYNKLICLPTFTGIEKSLAYLNA